MQKRTGSRAWVHSRLKGQCHAYCQLLSAALFKLESGLRVAGPFFFSVMPSLGLPHAHRGRFPAILLAICQT